ncbi:DUF2953 domain-containing protein [Clostridium bornimense]|uniref:DUF2953 domain-containing protein n=1 Tax=Clostridium bornimense TaxID=1216932 RepID=UPI001C109654|nr:DUF2953 domain-containing protein [Clostridium bornimense]MBU5314671.1 DUF2953 domain-containing protein [Clostridium bornimense]
MFYIFFIILLLLLVPIKINIHLIYKNKKTTVLLWNHKIDLHKFNKKKSNNPNMTSLDYKNTDKLTEKNEPSFKLKYKKFKMYHIVLKKLLPINTLDIKLKYGFDEPHITAITYGFKDLLNCYFINILNYFFKIKNYSINIIPSLKEKDLYISVNSIIYISIGKIIFIAIKLLLKKYKNKENKEKLQQNMKV